jgi:ATP phosphoribosyltransferase
MTERQPLLLALPSKGRLMDQTVAALARAGITVEKTGHARGYRGRIVGLDDVEVLYLSASEIAGNLKEGAVHLGVTGEDLLRETVSDMDRTVDLVHPLGFGRADVVVAVPDAWLDVNTMVDLEDVAAAFFARHGRRLRVATKYVNITRRFFADRGVSGYRIVESLGATEGTPASGAAELIVDITTTGSTLRANHLKVLDDGVILRSEAQLAASKVALWSPEALAARQRIAEMLRGP